MRWPAPHPAVTHKNHIMWKGLLKGHKNEISGGETLHFERLADYQSYQE